MKKLLKSFAIVSLAILGCNNPDSENSAARDTQVNGVVDTLVSQPPIQPQTDFVDAKAAVEKLDAVLNRYEEPSQTFEVASDKPVDVKGEKGTVIYLNPNDFETTSGKPLGSSIRVELKELTNQTDFVYHNVQTVSDGNLLVSGGAYYIDMMSDGQKLKIKKGRTLKVKFPRISDEEMSLFYGQRDSIGNMNWKQANEKFITKNLTVDEIKKGRIIGQWATMRNDTFPQSGFVYDTTNLSEEEKKILKNENEVYNKVYESIDILNFGWINCDRFINSQTTALALEFNSKDSVLFANLILVFQDLNSLMRDYFISGQNSTNEIFSRVPIGAKVRLIAYTVKGDKVFASSSDITTKVGQVITPTLQAMDERDFKKLLTSHY